MGVHDLIFAAMVILAVLILATFAITTWKEVQLAREETFRGKRNIFEVKDRGDSQ